MKTNNIKLKKIGLVIFAIFFLINLKITFDSNLEDGSISFWGINIKVIEDTYAENSVPLTGTCCKAENSICKIAKKEIKKVRYQSEGPCPDKPKK